MSSFNTVNQNKFITLYSVSELSLLLYNMHIHDVEFVPVSNQKHLSEK